MNEKKENKAKVLVIDSILENVRMLSEDLEADGFSVISSISGLEGINLAKLEQPDTILLDIMTPDIDGFEICRILKSDHLTSEIPVILISAREGIDDIIKGLDLGAFDYISKPFHYSITAARVRSAVRLKTSTDEIKAINEQLNIAKNAAVSAAKAKGLFVATMSHEIRTPLNGVLGMSKLLMNTQLNEKQQEFVSIINSSGTLLNELLDNILDYSKFESNKVTVENIPFALPSLLTGVESVVHAKLLEKQLQFIQNIDSELPNILIGDPTRIRQVLVNLISNAVKFTTNGSITLRLKLMNLSANNCQIRVEVIDTGIGIEQQQLTSLFKPFLQANKSTTRLYGGSGLGLAICKETIDLLQGNIGIISTLGQGSTFWFELSLGIPTANFEAGSIEKGAITTAITDTQNMLKGKKILLAEDNKPSQLIAISLLKQIGANVDVAENGKIALEKFSNNHYDIILMDCQMPEIDGFEVTKTIREGEHPDKDIVIIALTANSMSEQRALCLDAGMNDHLRKPYEKDELYRMLDRWLNHT